MDKSFSETYLNFQQVSWDTLKEAINDTLFMTIVSMLIVFVLGLLLGLLLYSLGRKHSAARSILYGLVSILSNIFRSTPFMILMVLIIPFTKALVGTMLGAKAAIPALVLSAAPFYARLVEIAFREVDSGVLEAADSMGASYFQTIYKVLIPKLASIDFRVNSYFGFDDRFYRDGGCNWCRWTWSIGLARRLSTW